MNVNRRVSIGRMQLGWRAAYPQGLPPLLPHRCGDLVFRSGFATDYCPVLRCVNGVGDTWLRIPVSHYHPKCVRRSGTQLSIWNNLIDNWRVL